MHPKGHVPRGGGGKETFGQKNFGLKFSFPKKSDLPDVSSVGHPPGLQTWSSMSSDVCADFLQCFLCRGSPSVANLEL